MTIAQVSRVVYSRPGIADFVAQLIAAAAAVGPLHLATIHLYTANLVPTPNTTEADLVEVDVGSWAEYVPIASTGWGAQDVRTDGSVMIVSTPLLSWTGPAAGGGPTVYGMFAKSPLAGTHYLCAMPFTSPVGMTNDTVTLTTMAPFVLGGTQPAV